MHFKIDWASLIVGSKFIVFALFYFVFESNFPSTSSWGAYIRRGNLTDGFLCYWFGGLIFGGSYTWRGLFSEFYGISQTEPRCVRRSILTLEVPTMTNFLSLIIITRQYREEKVVKISEIFTKGKVL